MPEFKFNDTICLIDHPEIFGICEGQVASDDSTNGQVLMRINVKGMPAETKKLLKYRHSANPGSDNSILYYCNLSELKLAERHNDNIGKKRKTRQ